MGDLHSSPDRYVPPPLAVRVLASLYLAVFGRKLFFRWNQLLLTVAARGMCVSDPMLKTMGPGEEGFLRRIARVENLAVFDIGANVGAYSARLREFCPSARIWAFEPHPSTFEQLAGVAAASGFTPVNLGVSDRQGKAHLYDYVDSVDGLGSVHASLHRQVIEDLHGSNAASVEVDVTTVDDAMNSLNIQRLNLLKIDAEGHELAILRGAAQAIMSGQIDIVQFEFNEMNVVSRVFFRDFYGALPGFSLYRMVVDGLAAVGDYQARTHELFFLHNVVAIRDGLEYGPSLV